MLRPPTLADAAAWADVVAACSPYLVQDARSTAHEIEFDPPASRRFVAESGGRVVGVARGYAYADEDHLSALVMVAPEHRRRGVGTALLAAMRRYADEAGRPVLRAVVEDDDAARAAATAWGFDRVRSFTMQAVDPSSVAEPAPPPPGATVVSLAELETRAIWTAVCAVVRDDPSGLSLPVEYDEFLDDWRDPRTRPDLSRAVLVAGEIAAFTLLGAAGDRAWSDMTGTLAAYRGRGFALLVKQHALRAAAAAGIDRCFTGNDAANQPMLAVNTRLGYRPFAEPSLWECRLRA